MFKIGTISLSISGVRERQVVFGAGKMSCCRLHKNAAHFSQLWMRRVTRGRRERWFLARNVNLFDAVQSMLGQRARKFTQYMIRISPIENYEDFLKLANEPMWWQFCFFSKFGIHATWKFNLRNRLARNLPEWWFFVCLLLLLPAALSYWFPFIELSYFTVQTAFTVANAEFLIWSTFFLNCFYSLFALIRIAG